MKLKSVAYLCKTLAVVGLLTPSLGLPFSIGEIHLNSTLNQAVNAEFKLNLAEGENASDISVRLATAEKFEQAGIAWNPLLSGLQFQTTNQNNGSVTVKVSSKEPLTSAALSLLVEVSSPQGTQLKAFTAQTSPVVNQTQSDAPSETVKPSKKVPGFNPESLNATSTEYGPLKASDTLWSIAAHLGKQRGLSTKQMLTALQKANPDAFNNGSIDSLKPDAMLQIPSADASLELASKPHQPTESAPAIKNKALELAAPTETTISDKIEVGSQAKSEPQPQPQPQPEPNPSTPAVIANSPTTGNNDFLALQTKIAALEQQLSMMQQLLALKDQQLAILQNANKNQFAQANPPQPKTELDQSLWLIAGLGFSLLTGLSWLLWRKNQQDQQQQRDVEAIFANNALQPAPAINNGFSFDQIAVANQALTNKSDFDFNLEFFEAPNPSKTTDATDTDWTDDNQNETKIDLAKAYIDMGDLEMAKIIAEEVMKTGNQQQKAQAEALLTEL